MVALTLAGILPRVTSDEQQNDKIKKKKGQTKENTYVSCGNLNVLKTQQWQTRTRHRSQQTYNKGFEKEEKGKVYLH